MSRQEYKATEKKVNKMTRDGLSEENLTTGSRENISKRIKDADFKKTSDSLSYVSKSKLGKTDRPKQRQNKELVGIEPLEKKETYLSENQRVDGNKETTAEKTEDTNSLEKQKKGYQRKRKDKAYKSRKSSLQFDGEKKPIL